ncbi:C-type lectin domain family 1 member A [Heterocephalus glaber]|uniref:C-type lectin domain family 1 member A n=1 Tax=Heterocephalus glaber TaxID=10181 RepID=G5BDZ5_HETGA|nr:C-type lectin domain family 1 member A [Heterocephalus glaber]
MQAKYSSTRDMRGMLDDDEDTTLSLHSQASATTWQPEPRPTELRTPLSTWRPVALTLLTLCLVLLTGLAALGLVWLSRNGSGKTWLWMDGTPYSFELFEIIIDTSLLRSRDCVTILNGKAFSKDCRELRRCACERTAGRVDPEKLH